MAGAPGVALRVAGALGLVLPVAGARDADGLGGLALVDGEPAGPASPPTRSTADVQPATNATVSIAPTSRFPRMGDPSFAGLSQGLMHRYGRWFT